MIKTEVFTKIVEEKMKGNAKLLNFATDMGELPNGVQAGETHTILKWKHIGEAKDLKKGEKIETEEMQNETSKETIEHKAKGILIYDYEKKTSVDGMSAEDRGARQIAEVLTRAREKSLATKMLKAPLKFATADKNAITAQELNQAMVTGFGDNQDTADMACILINSRTSACFYTMPEFVDSMKTYNGLNGNGIVQNGVIGYFRGIPVVMADYSTFDNGECVTFIIKKGAIGYKNCGAVGIESVRNAEYKRDEIYGDDLFVTGVLDDSGVIVMRKTIA